MVYIEGLGVKRVHFRNSLQPSSSRSSLQVRGKNMTQKLSLNETLQVLITDEVMKLLGLGLTHWSRQGIHNFIKKGTQHFADLFAVLDAEIGPYGLTQAVRRLLPNFIAGCYHHGTSHVPSTGPLLVTSNHPGAAEAMTILALLQRDDVKIVISGIPFLTALSNVQQHFIRVTSDLATRSLAIREIISHLKNSGAVIIFPTGHMTPDPELTPDMALVFEDWSQSIALILRRVPGVKLLMTVISGVIEPRFLRSPLCKLRKSKRHQQILAEFMQIIWQMMHPATTTITPRVTFMPPISGSTLAEFGHIKGMDARMGLHTAILSKAAEALIHHISVRDDAVYATFP